MTSRSGSTLPGILTICLKMMITRPFMQLPSGRTTPRRLRTAIMTSRKTACGSRASLSSAEPTSRMSSQAWSTKLASSRIRAVSGCWRTTWNSSTRSRSSSPLPWSTWKTSMPKSFMWVGRSRNSNLTKRLKRRLNLSTSSGPWWLSTRRQTPSGSGPLSFRERSNPRRWRLKSVQCGAFPSSSRRSSSRTTSPNQQMSQRR
mmetsp:Transcript_29480/g.52727  ORF Transcript_29480/g.52727 Transcript_29480/m.52727 type:complete len:202 (+) Transcript_29480:1256-1861(+)